jgi:hypothetical protein
MGKYQLNVAQYLLLEQAIEECGVKKVLARGVSGPFVESLMAGGYCVPDGTRFMVTALGESFAEKARFAPAQNLYWID